MWTHLGIVRFHTLSTVSKCKSPKHGRVKSLLGFLLVPCPLDSLPCHLCTPSKIVWKPFILRCMNKGDVLYKIIFKSNFLYKVTKKMESGQAYVKMMKNNIQSTCIANIINHVFVVQVEIQGLYSYWPATGKHMILNDQQEPPNSYSQS